jgi:hypothetical protein
MRICLILLFHSHRSGFTMEEVRHPSAEEAMRECRRIFRESGATRCEIFDRVTTLEALTETTKAL